MATGSGKTVVMAMLIAWQTLNKVQSARETPASPTGSSSSRPASRSATGCGCCCPSDPENYYDLRDLIPADLRAASSTRAIVITNYHSFLLKDAKEIKGVATNTRSSCSRATGKDDPFKETPQAMVAPGPARPRRRTSSEIVVLNDEAHHCYQDKPLQAGEKARRRGARQDAQRARPGSGSAGLQAIAKQVGIKPIYDLSATPFYLAAPATTRATSSRGWSATSR